MGELFECIEPLLRGMVQCDRESVTNFRQNTSACNIFH